MSQRTRVLVTGAAGFLGFYLARTLADDPNNFVFCVDNFVRGDDDIVYRDLTSRANVKRIDVDLTEFSSTLSLPGDVDIIFHLAALNGTQNFYERPFDVIRCCTLPTLHLIQYYGRSRCLRRFVYAGTSEAYASTVTRFNWKVPTSEDVPLSIDDVFNPRWSYGASKMHGEIATIHGCNHFKTPFTVIRFHNAYGPRMGDKHVIPDFLIRAATGIFALYGHEDTRSFIFAEDAVRATIALSQADAAAGEIVNVGGSREIRMLELGELMMKICGFEGRISLHSSPSGSVSRRTPNIEKLTRITGYRELTGLDEGLALTAEYYLKTGLL